MVLRIIIQPYYLYTDNDKIVLMVRQKQVTVSMDHYTALSRIRLERLEAGLPAGRGLELLLAEAISEYLERHKAD